MFSQKNLQLAGTYGVVQFGSLNHVIIYPSNLAKIERQVNLK
jgi:hypothetical protein